MKVYHISGNKYKDLRPLKLQPDGNRRMKELLERGVSESYFKEINFFLGKPTKDQINLAVKEGFKNWDLPRFYIYQVDLRNLKHLNYISITSTPQHSQYIEVYWDKFYEENKHLPGGEFSKAKFKWLEGRDKYLDKHYDIRPRMGIDEIVGNPNYDDWCDFDKWFDYNLRHGDKKQYASYIPHLQVSVDRAIKYDRVEEITR